MPLGVAPVDRWMRFVAIAAWVVGLVALAAWQTVHPLFPRVALPPPGSVVAAELPDGNPVSDVLVLPGTRYVGTPDLGTAQG